MEDDYYSSYNRRIPVGDIFEQVKQDLDGRNALGYSLHRRILNDEVNKDWLQEGYEESLDLTVYLKGELNRRTNLGEDCSLVQKIYEKAIDIMISLKGELNLRGRENSR